MWTLCVVCEEEVLKEMEEEGERNSILGVVKNLGMEDSYGKRYMYLCVDFNGGWLKDSSLLWCIVILLSEEGRVVDNLQERCFIKLVVTYFFKTKSNEA